jgi:hypothetical protein
MRESENLIKICVFNYFSLCYVLNLPSSRSSPASAGLGIAVPSTTTFASGFYIAGYVGSYACGLSKLLHKCVTDI